jgi:hypothetical protein
MDAYSHPRLKIFNTCTNLIRTLPSLPMSKTNSEDVDTRADDHAYDALRYMLMSQQSTRPPSTSFGMTHLNKPVIHDKVFGY